MDYLNTYASVMCGILPPYKINTHSNVNNSRNSRNINNNNGDNNNNNKK